MINFSKKIPFNPVVLDSSFKLPNLYITEKILKENMAFASFNTRFSREIPIDKHNSIIKMFTLSQGDLVRYYHITHALVALKNLKGAAYPSSLQKVRRIIEFPGIYDGIYKVFQVELQYSQGYGLDNLLSSKGTNFSLFKETYSIPLLLKDILNAVNFLHENDIIHNNLLLSNIIYNESVYNETSVKSRGFLVGFSQLIYLGNSSKEDKQIAKTREAYYLGSMFIALFNLGLSEVEYFEIINEIQSNRGVIMHISQPLLSVIQIHHHLLTPITSTLLPL